MSDDFPEADTTTMEKSDASQLPALPAAGVIAARITQYLLTTLAAVITYGALQLSALEATVLGVYVLVLLGFVVVGELVVVQPLKDWGG